MSFTSSPSRPKFMEALKFWSKLGWISFGGTAGHIGLMHDFLVVKKRWISNARFFHALSICMLLPGPEAQQLSIYIGQLLHGRKGGIAAGILFVLPSTLILLLLSIAYVTFGNLPWIQAIFSGLKPAVIALIIMALFKIGQKSLRGWLHIAVAFISFLALFLFNTPLPLILLAAIAFAGVVQWIRPSLLFREAESAGKYLQEEKSYFINTLSTTGNQKFRVAEFLRLLGVFLILWVLPLCAFRIFAGDHAFWQNLIFFFTRAAIFTIGGSYTVLPYVAQFAVGKVNWLSRIQMVDGFALAETTPGPLIIVVGFVGFMAAYNHFSNSLLLGSLALFVTVFYTFLPCFFYIFAGAPLIHGSHNSKILNGMLQLVTAAVVGVILNLTVFLGTAVIFPGGVSLSHPDIVSVIWIIISVILISKMKMNVIYLILLSMAGGFLRFLIHAIY